MKITKWRPDTCDCEIDYQWDDSIDLKDRTHTISKIVKACDHHKNLLIKVEHYNVVVDENTRKNKVFGQILKNCPNAVEEVDDGNGNMVKKLKIGKKYEWSFDKDRNLVVNLNGFTESDKNSLKSVSQSLFGSKVKFN